MKTFSRWKAGSATLDELKDASVESLRKGIRMDGQMPWSLLSLTCANADVMGLMGRENVPSIALMGPSGTIHLPPKTAWAIREAIRFDGDYEMPEVRDALVLMAVMANQRSDSPEVLGARGLFLDTMKNILLGEDRLTTICCTSVDIEGQAGWEKWMRFAFGKNQYMAVMENPDYSLADSECAAEVIEPWHRKLTYGQMDEAAAGELVNGLALHISSHEGRECSESRFANLACEQSVWGRNYLREPSDLSLAEIAVPLGQKITGRLEVP